MNDIAAAGVTEFDDVVLTPLMPASAEPAVAKPRIWTVFAVFVAVCVLVVVSQVVVTMLLVLIEVMRGNDVQQVAQELPSKLVTFPVFLPMAAASQLVFLFGAIGAAWLSPAPMKQRLGLCRPQPGWSIVPMVMIGSWASQGVGMALAVWLSQYIEPNQLLEDLYEGITPAQAIPFTLFIAIAPAIAEELLFRGYIQRRLLERWSPAVAITVTSLLFAAVHGQLHHSLAVFPMGMWMGYVAWKTGSVIASMFCHLFINGMLTSWALIARFSGISEHRELDVQLMAFALGVLYFLACIVRFWHLREPQSTVEAALPVA